MNDETEAVHNPAFPIDRKVWVPAVAMIVTFVVTTFVSRHGIDIPADLQYEIKSLIMIMVGGVVGWFTPMARAEITSRMTNSLIEEAQADPVSPVNLSEIIDNDIVAEAQANPVSKVNLVEIVDNKLILEAQLSQASPATIPKGETKTSLEKKLVVETLTPAVMPSAPKPKSKRGKA